MSKRLTFKTAGYSATNILRFDARPSSCGKITDGVTLAHDDRGCWLIDFKDLEKMYEAAKAARQPKPRKLRLRSAGDNSSP